MRILLSILISLTFCLQSNAQDQHKLDSLMTLYNQAQNDTTRIILLNDEIGYLYESINLDSAIYYYNLAVNLADKNLDKFTTETKQSYEYYIYLSLKSKSLGYLGNVNELKDVYDIALEYYLKALELNEILVSCKDPNLIMLGKQGISKCYGNIGNMQLYQKNYDNAIEYLLKAITIFEDIDDKRGAATCFVNIGKAYFQKDDYDNTLNCVNKASKIFEEIGDKRGLSACYINLGSVQHMNRNYKQAITNYLKSLEIKEELDDKRGMAIINGNISVLYSDIADSLKSNKPKWKSNLDSALVYGLKAMEIANEIGSISAMNSAANKIKDIYIKKSDYQKAIEYFEIFIATQDSMFNEDKTNALVEMSTKYESEKKQLEIDKMQNQKELDNKTIEAQQAENRKQFIIIMSSILGFIIVLVFSIILLRMFRHKRKANILLSEQKAEIEEKNRDILDSITYAKRIQSAILPPQKLVKEYLKDSFILYKPKDIVAGDFYWMEHKDGKILFAAADCTGHGVPGAMVSVVCNNGLNRSVREYGLTEPGMILNKTREIVIQEFEKSEEEVSDGMDIALCSLDGHKLEYSGAHNPLWIIRNGEILETKSNRQPIGKSRLSEPFTTHTIELQKDDTLYIFSDGYVDQFGGENGKKFKSKAFKDLLLSIQIKTMEEQRLHLDENFETWRGKLEQIDDVCVIGVRI